MRGQAIARSSEKSKPSPSSGPPGSGCCCFSTSVWYSRLPASWASGVGERSFSTGKKPFARHCEGSCASTNSRDGAASSSRVVS